MKKLRDNLIEALTREIWKHCREYNMRKYDGNKRCYESAVASADVVAVITDIIFVACHC